MCLVCFFIFVMCLFVCVVAFGVLFCLVRVVCCFGLVCVRVVGFVVVLLCFVFACCVRVCARLRLRVHVCVCVCV